jgi:hypothetical protein
MVENRTGINKILLDLEEEGNCLQMHAAFTINRYLQNAYYFHHPRGAFLARLCVLGDPRKYFRKILIWMHYIITPDSIFIE